MPKLTYIFHEKEIIKKEGDGDLDLNATIKEYWEDKLETCDQKFAEKVRYQVIEVIKNKNKYIVFFFPLPCVIMMISQLAEFKIYKGLFGISFQIIIFSF